MKLFQRRAQTQWAADQRRRDVLMTITAINPFRQAILTGRRHRSSLSWSARAVCATVWRFDSCEMEKFASKLSKRRTHKQSVFFFLLAFAAIVGMPTAERPTKTLRFFECQRASSTRRSPLKFPPAHKGWALGTLPAAAKISAYLNIYLLHAACTEAASWRSRQPPRGRQPTGGVSGGINDHFVLWSIRNEAAGNYNILSL